MTTIIRELYRFRPEHFRELQGWRGRNHVVLWCDYDQHVSLDSGGCLLN